MSATTNICPNTTKPPVVREYDIGDTKYIVKATVKAGANTSPYTFPTVTKKT